MVYTIQSRDELVQKLTEAGEKLVVIDFFANWCGPCKIISPKLDELAILYADKASMLKINVDDNEELALEYNVTSLPTFVFIKSQQIVDMFIGGNTEKLVKSVERLVGEAESATFEDAVEVEEGEVIDDVTAFSIEPLPEQYLETEQQFLEQQ